MTTEQPDFEFEPEGENQARTGPVTCLGMAFKHQVFRLIRQREDTDDQVITEAGHAWPVYKFACSAWV